MSLTFADELRQAALMEPVGVGGVKTLRPRYDAIAVLTVAEGFDRLLALCRAKRIFTRPFWRAMNPPVAADEAQLRWFVQRPGPLALWAPGSYMRLLERTEPAVVWSHLSVGSGLSLEPSRLAMYRALWDIGIRRLHNTFHRDTPYAQAIIARGQYQITEDGPYLRGVMDLT
ncbi:MAG TPA: hypothetical protein VJ816_03160, partial [Gemmatimonadales bacterium]|nr:hypothetical protein [Gemmatimonadales bacterium]